MVNSSPVQLEVVQEPGLVKGRSSAFIALQLDC